MPSAKMQTKKSTIKIKEQEDIVRLKAAARRMIGFLEEEIDEPFPDDARGAEQRQKQCEFLFGARNSLAAGLLLITELIGRLAQAEGGPPDAEAANTKLTPADVALIRDFVRRTEPPAP